MLFLPLLFPSGHPPRWIGYITRRLGGVKGFGEAIRDAIVRRFRRRVRAQPRRRGAAGSPPAALACRPAPVPRPPPPPVPRPPGRPALPSPAAAPVPRPPGRP